MDPREQNLVRAARAGDTEAFTQLYEDNYQQVYALAYEVLRERNTAAGVLRDTFAAAWTRLDAMPEGEPFSRWVLRLCSAQCDAVLHGSGASQWLDNAAALELLTDADPETFRLPQPYLVQPELMARLDGAVAALPERQRRALTLYYHNGLTLSEAADVLGTSPARVKSDLARARREIVRRLRNEEEAAGEAYGWTTERETRPFRAALAAQLGGVMLTGGAAGLLLKHVLASLTGGGSSAAVTGAEGAAIGAEAAATTGGKIAGAKAAAAAGGKAAATVGGKLAAMSTTTKIIAGVTAAAVVAGGGYGIKKAVDSGAADRAEPVEETAPLEGAGAAAASVRVLDRVTVYDPEGGQTCTESYDYDENLYVIRSECDGDADIALVGTFDYEYEYDADGRATSVKRDGTEVRAWSYDDAGHMTKQYYKYTYADDSGDGTTTTYYTYDAQGTRTEMHEVIEGVYPSDSAFRCTASPNDSGGVDLEMEMTSGEPDAYPYRFESYDAEGRITIEGAEYAQYYYYNDENGITLAEITPGDTVEHGSPYANVYFVLMDSANKIYHRLSLGTGGDYKPTFDDDGNLTRVDFSDGAYAEFTYRDPNDEPEPEPEPEDTAWKQAYLDFLQEFAVSEDRNLEAYTFSLVYIDDDSVPEMVLSGKYAASGSFVCSYHDGEVRWESGAAWGVQVLEREGLWLDSYMHSGYGREVVWELRDGRFIELGTGTFEADIQNYDDVTYYWNDEEVSEETYKAELARLFDADRATYIDTGVEYDAFTAQLRS